MAITIRQDQKVTLTAISLDGTGAAMTGPSFTWETSDPCVVLSAADGVSVEAIGGQTTGVATITVMSSDGHAATQTINVVTPGEASVSIRQDQIDRK